MKVIKLYLELDISQVTTDGPDDTSDEVVQALQDHLDEGFWTDNRGYEIDLVKLEEA